MRRVVVTGLGVVSPLGTTADRSWARLCAGESAIGPLTIIPTDDLKVTIAAEIADFDGAAHFEPSTLATLDRFAQFAVVAAREAVADAGLVLAETDPARTATIIGSGVGGQSTEDESYQRVYGENAKRLHPFTIPRLMINAAASAITMDQGIIGPSFTVASACASAAHAIGTALHMVRGGAVDRAIAGGTEACITYGTMKGWEALRVMASDTCRPFSKDRTGMVLGEGAAIFVLETAEAAARRGATAYAELAGVGMSADAADLVQPSAAGAAQAMRSALDDAGLPPHAIAYVNAHGTGTAANDVTETAAIRAVFGPAADRLAVSSTKSMHGHAMGASPALEFAATLLAVRHGIVPPTANYREPDPACDLDYVPGAARAMPIRAALSNAFAFGGLNATLAVKRLEA